MSILHIASQDLFDQKPFLPCDIQFPIPHSDSSNQIFTLFLCIQIVFRLHISVRSCSNFLSEYGVLCLASIFQGTHVVISHGFPMLRLSNSRSVSVSLSHTEQLVFFHPFFFFCRFFILCGSVQLGKAEFFL